MRSRRRSFDQWIAKGSRFESVRSSLGGFEVGFVGQNELEETKVIVGWNDSRSSPTPSLTSLTSVSTSKEGNFGLVRALSAWKRFVWMRKRERRKIAESNTFVFLERLPEILEEKDEDARELRESIARKLAKVLLVQGFVRHDRLSIIKAFHRLRANWKKHEILRIRISRMFLHVRLRNLRTGFQALYFNKALQNALDEAYTSIHRTQDVLQNATAHVKLLHVETFTQQKLHAMSMLERILRSRQHSQKVRGFSSWKLCRQESIANAVLRIMSALFNSKAIKNSAFLRFKEHFVVTKAYRCRYSQFVQYFGHILHICHSKTLKRRLSTWKSLVFKRRKREGLLLKTVARMSRLDSSQAFQKLKQTCHGRTFAKIQLRTTLLRWRKFLVRAAFLKWARHVSTLQLLESLSFQKHHTILRLSFSALQNELTLRTQRNICLRRLRNRQLGKYCENSFRRWKAFTIICSRRYRSLLKASQKWEMKNLKEAFQHWRRYVAQFHHRDSVLQKFAGILSAKSLRNAWQTWNHQHRQNRHRLLMSRVILRWILQGERRKKHQVFRILHVNAAFMHGEIRAQRETVLRTRFRTWLVFVNLRRKFRDALTGLGRFPKSEIQREFLHRLRMHAILLRCAESLTHRCNRSWMESCFKFWKQQHCLGLTWLRAVSVLTRARVKIFRKQVFQKLQIQCKILGALERMLCGIQRDHFQRRKRTAFQFWRISQNRQRILRRILNQWLNRGIRAAFQAFKNWIWTLNEDRWRLLLMRSIIKRLQEKSFSKRIAFEALECNVIKSSQLDRFISVHGRFQKREALVLLKIHVQNLRIWEIRLAQKSFSAWKAFMRTRNLLHKHRSSTAAMRVERILLQKCFIAWGEMAEFKARRRRFVQHFVEDARRKRLRCHLSTWRIWKLQQARIREIMRGRREQVKMASFVQWKSVIESRKRIFFLLRRWSIRLLSQSFCIWKDFNLLTIEQGLKMEERLRKFVLSQPKWMKRSAMQRWRVFVWNLSQERQNALTRSLTLFPIIIRFQMLSLRGAFGCWLAKLRRGSIFKDRFQAIFVVRTERLKFLALDKWKLKQIKMRTRDRFIKILKRKEKRILSTCLSGWQQDIRESQLRMLQISVLLQRQCFQLSQLAFSKWISFSSRQSRISLIVFRALRISVRRKSSLAFEVLRRHSNLARAAGNFCASLEAVMTSALLRYVFGRFKHRKGLGDLLSARIHSKASSFKRNVLTKLQVNVEESRRAILSRIVVRICLKRMLFLNSSFTKLKRWANHGKKREIVVERLLRRLRFANANEFFHIMKTKSVVRICLKKLILKRRGSLLRLCLQRLKLFRASAFFSEKNSLARKVASSQTIRSAEQVLVREVSKLLFSTSEAKIEVILGRRINFRETLVKPSEKCIRNHADQIVGIIRPKDAELTAKQRIMLDEGLDGLGGIIGSKWMALVRQQSNQLERCFRHAQERELKTAFSRISNSCRNGAIREAQLRSALEHYQMNDSPETETFRNDMRHIEMHSALSRLESVIDAHKSTASSLANAINRLARWNIEQKSQSTKILYMICLLKSTGKQRLLEGWRRWVSVDLSLLKTSIVSHERKNLQYSTVFIRWKAFLAQRRQNAILRSTERHQAAKLIAFFRLNAVLKKAWNQKRIHRAFSRFHLQSETQKAKKGVLKMMEDMLSREFGRSVLRKCFMRWRVVSSLSIRGRLASMVEFTASGYEVTRTRFDEMERSLVLCKHFQHLRLALRQNVLARHRSVQHFFNIWSTCVDRGKGRKLSKRSNQVKECIRMLRLFRGFVLWKFHARARRRVRGYLKRKCKRIDGYKLLEAFLTWRDLVSRLSLLEKVVHAHQRRQSHWNLLRGFQRLLAFMRCYRRRQNALYLTLLRIGRVQTQKRMTFHIWLSANTLARRVASESGKLQAAASIYRLVLALFEGHSSNRWTVSTCFMELKSHMKQKHFMQLKGCFHEWKLFWAFNVKRKARNEELIRRSQSLLLWKKRKEVFESWKWTRKRAKSIKARSVISSKFASRRILGQHFMAWSLFVRRQYRQDRDWFVLGHCIARWKMFLRMKLDCRFSLIQKLKVQEVKQLSASFRKWSRIPDKEVTAKLLLTSEKFALALKDKENVILEMDHNEEALKVLVSEVKTKAKKRIKQLLQSNQELESQVIDLEAQLHERDKKAQLFEAQLREANEQLSNLRQRDVDSEMETYVADLEAKLFDANKDVDQLKRKLTKRAKRIDSLTRELEDVEVRMQHVSFISRVERESFCSTLLSNITAEIEDDQV